LEFHHPPSELFICPSELITPPLEITMLSSEHITLALEFHRPPPELFMPRSEPMICPSRLFVSAPEL